MTCLLDDQNNNIFSREVGGGKKLVLRAQFMLNIKSIGVEELNKSLSIFLSGSLCAKKYF